MLLELANLTKEGFAGLPIVSFYSTTGEVIASQFIEPVLRESVAFDRLTGYFSVQSLVSVASGLQGLYVNKGKMRLVLGMHDVPVELISAMSLGQLLPADLVETYKNRLISEVDFLSDEVQRSAISGIAWMMRLGILEVKVAAPRSSRGIFHQKRMIFRDRFGNIIAGTGSLNETIGSRENVEEMQFNLSWQTGFSGVNLLVQSFEQIWSNSAPEVSVFDLDEEFATQILLRTKYQQNPFKLPDSTRLVNPKVVLELARSGIAFTPFNLSSAVLYPHQERVFAEALSRWPVRVLMADEVGLGKTLEAGTAIAYLHKFHDVREVTILAPAGLARQWQEELWKHFGLDFWRWESGSSSYVSASGQINHSTFAGDTKASRPELRIVSAQWARMKPHEFKKVIPQLLVVDEAHAARVTETKYGSKSTLLWKLLNELCEQIPHVILLTATPMQVHPSEYQGLLALLGLPEDWRDYSNYEESLRIIAGFKERPSLQQAKQLSSLLISSFNSNQWIPALLTQAEMLLIMELRSKTEKSVLEGAKIVLNEFQAFRTVLIKIHPGHFFTCRNTKTGLKQFGYVFPERRFIAPEISVPPKLERLERGIENYLSTSYGKTEEALAPKSRFPIAFARTSYYQRLVSSLYAARESLRRRKSKISAISSTVNLDAFDFGNAQLSDFVDDEDSVLESSFYDDLESRLSELSDVERSRVEVAVRQELLHINQLIEILDDLGEDISKSDPKFEVVMNNLEQLLMEGPVLVFSRYVDTLKGFLGLFQKSSLAYQVNGYGFYTGADVWIKTSAGTYDATKTDVMNALDENRISIVFCSDAASEGLNLQSSRSIINIDVPWNPARLEQRIGRVARLGQKSKVVNIVNVWYPNSIESRMYSKLLERKEDYELAVGEFPDIFSDSIRQEVADLLNPGNPLVSNLAADLVGLRQNFQTVALKEIWKSENSEFPASREMRQDLILYVSKVFKDSGYETELLELSSDPGQRTSIGINHEVLDRATEFPPVGSSSSTVNLYSCYQGETFVSFAISERKEKMKLMNPLSIGRLLRAIAGENCLTDEDFGTEFSVSSAGQHVRRFIEELTNIPHHGRARTAASNQDDQFQLTGEVSFRYLGEI